VVAAVDYGVTSDVATTDEELHVAATLVSEVPETALERRATSVFAAETPQDLASAEEELEDGTWYFAPHPEQSAQATEEVAAVAAAVAVTKANEATAKPVLVPPDFDADAIVIDKKELSTKLGIFLTNDKVNSHPVVVRIAEDGAAATPACQLQGVLMAGDKIMSLEAATNVVRVDTATDCKHSATATSAMLKKSVGQVKIGIQREGVPSVVVVDKPKQDMTLGILLESSPAWEHPRVQSIGDGPCVGKLEPDDVVVSVEAATEVAKLDTNPKVSSHLVSTAFLKSAVGPVQIHVHRIKDVQKRRASVAAMVAAATPADIATTDTELHVAANVVNEVPTASRERRATGVFSEPDNEADEGPSPLEEASNASSALEPFFWYVAPADHQSDKAAEEVVAAAVAVAATQASEATAKPVKVPSGFGGDDIIVRKEELSTKLGIALTNDKDEGPIVVAISEHGAAAKPESQIQGVLLAGDRLLSIEAATHVVHINFVGSCGKSADATTPMLQKAIGVIKLVIERDGNTRLVKVVKEKQSSKLGITIESSASWNHPVVRTVKEGPCEGKIEVGDKIHSIEAATEWGKLDTRHDETRGAKNAHLLATTGFLKSAIGDVHLRVHRLKDEKKRQQSVATNALATKPETITTTDTELHVAAQMMSDPPHTAKARKSTLRFSFGNKSSSAVDVSDPVQPSKKVVSFAKTPSVAKSRRASSIAKQSSVVTEAVAATAAAPTAVASSAESETMKVTVVINKEDVASKLGVTMTSCTTDSHPIVAKVADGGAAATPACQLSGVLLPGDKIVSVAGYTHVVHLDTKASWSAVPAAAMLKKSVGLVKFHVQRKGEDVAVNVEKSVASDKLGVELRSAPGEKHPTIIGVADRFTQGRAAGKLEVGDVLLSVQAATVSETIGMAATLGANGHAALTTSVFLSSALGPITFEVVRTKDKKVRRASVAALSTKQADLHDSDGHDTNMSTIAAADVDANKDGNVSAEELKKVGFGGGKLGKKEDGQHA